MCRLVHGIVWIASKKGNMSNDALSRIAVNRTYVHQYCVDTDENVLTCFWTLSKRMLFFHLTFVVVAIIIEFISHIDFGCVHVFFFSQFISRRQSICFFFLRSDQCNRYSICFFSYCLLLLSSIKCAIFWIGKPVQSTYMPKNTLLRSINLVSDYDPPWHSISSPLNMTINFGTKMQWNTE